ncbi:hypothetical protein RCH13_000844 [Chryseobacterium sp. MP_3.2]|nr:hypothetical protein [Chryseobacterium sp. MP_3.2]
MSLRRNPFLQNIGYLTVRRFQHNSPFVIP